MSPDSALGFVLQIHQQLLQLDDQREEEVREALFQLYTGNKEPEKRRFLALTAVRQASDRDNEYIQYQFANTWASGVKKSDPERKFAEALFEQVVLERAYLEGFKGEMGESRGYFSRPPFKPALWKAISDSSKRGLPRGARISRGTMPSSSNATRRTPPTDSCGRTCGPATFGIRRVERPMMLG